MKEIWNVVLAAGNSTRMKGIHKLLMKIDGETILRHSVKKAVSNNASHTLVVLNSRFLGIVEELGNLPISIIWNHDPLLGISYSISLAIKHLPKTCNAAVILLADQPEMKVEVMNKLIVKYRTSNKPLGLTIYQTIIRHPILFDRLFFQDLLKLEGDQGAKTIINAHKEKAFINCVDEEAPQDIDTLEDYTSLFERNIWKKN